MSLVLSSCFIVPSNINHVKATDLIIPKISLSDPNCTSFHGNIPQKSLIPNRNITMILKHKPPSSKFIARECLTSSEEIIVDDDWSYQEDIETDDIESPWEGAILYQRNPSITHLEYCTTLERLGLGSFSTEVSKSRASLMGIRVTKSVKDFPLGTPVMISVDVTRKKHKLRLDGIIRTVITLGCYRCGGPAAEGVFSNFSLILTEEPIEEPEMINMGVIFGQDKVRSNGGEEDGEQDDDESVDLDDWLYFPPEEKVIDISKHLRDVVHLEITLNALCDPTCKGLCLKCGKNLNTSSCSCSKQKVKEKAYGPLGGLKEKMKQ